MRDGILENYITVSEFAEDARITTQAVRKRIKKRQLVATKIGHQYLIQEKELVKYLEGKGGRKYESRYRRN